MMTEVYAIKLTDWLAQLEAAARLLDLERRMKAMTPLDYDELVALDFTQWTARPVAQATFLGETS